MRRFIAEARRRKVHRAAALYLVGGYAAVEASDLLAPLLSLPPWTVRLVLVLVIVGFPLVMALAWTFDRSPDGLVRTPDVEDSVSTAVQPAPRPVPAPKGGRTSILVAPFSNNSPNPQDEYLADGLTDEIITDLSKVRSLRVIARSSAMRLKGAGDSLPEMAADLGVQYILDGSVRTSGDDVRITARLVHLSSGESRWSERYRATFSELFTVQEEVARSVAEALAVHIGASDEKALVSLGIEDPRAVESYLRARFETWKFSREGLVQAERHLKNGLAIVGDNPLLLTSLGQVYAWYANLGLDPEGDHIRRADECLAKVFALDPDAGRGHWLQGMVHFHSGDLRAARAPLERALAGLPNDPDTLMTLGYVSALSGQHHRADHLFHQAFDVDPLTPLNHGVRGFTSVLEGRPDEAVPHYRTYLDMDPDSPFALWCWIWLLLMAGRADDVEPHVRALGEVHPDSIFAPLAKALFAGVVGDPETVVQSIPPQLRAAAETNELFSRTLTHCLALAGQVSEALDWLENTVRIGNVNYPFWSRHDPWVKDLRSEPRFSHLMVQVEREWRSLNPELAI